MHTPLASRPRRLALQLGLLAGIGLAFAVSSGQPPALAGGEPQCPPEGPCTFKKVNVLFILDYSTSMNATFDAQRDLSGWEAATATLAQIVEPGGFISQNAHVALLRFGHDPDPGLPGTQIPNDDSGVVDGQVLDVGWYDPEELGVPWFGCNGQAIIDALEATPPPLGGAQTGIEPWTRGALDFATSYIATTKADHPEDLDDAVSRRYVNVLLTQGAWTGADGASSYGPANEDPTIPAAELWDNQDVVTLVYVVPGDVQAEAAANELAAAGGTTEAVPGDTPELLFEAMNVIVQDTLFSLIAPECDGVQARVMILLDASSAMLNVDGGTQAGAMGETAWDQAREALVGEDSLFQLELEPGVVVADVVHLGLAVFGDDNPMPGEQKLVAQYGPCMQDNFAWALAPESSCVQPGCTDPWAGPPISWTFVDGGVVGPQFDAQTFSHMPRCDGADDHCQGSGSFVHLGLELVASNQAQYAIASQQPNAPFPTTADTPFFNILITHGRYDGYSTDAQVQAELEQMFADGITTFVIGFGDLVDTSQAQVQLQSMAQWGSGGQANYYDAGSQAELADVLVQIVAAIEYDECCAFDDCSHNPEPTTNEPDPLPNWEDEGDGDPGSTDDGDESTGDGDGDGAEDSSDDEDDDDDDESDTGSPEETGDTGETGADGMGLLGRDGCGCTTNTPRPSAWMLAILGLVGLRRRSAHGQEASRT